MSPHSNYKLRIQMQATMLLLGTSSRQHCCYGLFGPIFSHLLSDYITYPRAVQFFVYIRMIQLHNKKHLNNIHQKIKMTVSKC